MAVAVFQGVPLGGVGGTTWAEGEGQIAVFRADHSPDIIRVVVCLTAC